MAVLALSDHIHNCEIRATAKVALKALGTPCRESMAAAKRLLNSLSQDVQQGILRQEVLDEITLEAKKLRLIA